MRRVLLLLLIPLTGLFAAERTVTVFKNGIGFIQEHLNFNVTQNLHHLDHQGKPLFGTFFITGDDLKSYRLTRLSTNKKDNNLSMMKLLTASKGATVTFEVNGQKEPVTGVVENISSGIVAIKSVGGITIHRIGNLKNVTLKKLPLLVKKEIKNQLELSFSKLGKKNLNLHYLTRNLSWFPTYRINLISKKRAVMRLEAMMVNDAENLKGVDLNLAVGVSNFKYNHLESPMNGTLSLSDFINALGGSRYGTYNRDNFRNDFSNTIMTQQRSSYSPRRSSGSGYQVGVTRNEDLYLFPIRDVTLLKGERARYKLFEKTISLEHIYDADLNVGAQQKPHKVWHSLKMKNSTSYPWTTGSAIVVKGDQDTQPISQDRLEYTPVGREGLLKITISPDISVVHQDKQIDHKNDVIKRNGYYYDKYIVQGTITVQNNKNETIKLNIRRNIIGNTMKSDQKWDVTHAFKNQKYDNSYGLNKQNEVVWELILKAGESRNISYKYNHYKR